MSSSIDYLPAPGLSVTAYNQAGPAAIGHQKDATVQLAEVTIGTSPMNPLTVTQVGAPCTYPAVALSAELANPTNTAGAVSLVVPFPCKVIGATFVSNGSTNPDTGDFFKIDLVPLTGSDSPICPDTQIGTAAHSVTAAAKLFLSAPSLKAGDAIRLTLTKDTNVEGTCYVTLVPVLA